MDELNNTRPQSDGLRPSQSQSASKSKRQNKLDNKQIGGIVAVSLLVIVSAFFIYQYSHTRSQLQKLKSNPQQAQQDEAHKLSNEISQTVDLPTGETPTVATVSDASKLQSQTFFAKAQNGDKVLIFTQAKKAVLYRPSTKKVIEYSTVNLGQ